MVARIFQWAIFAPGLTLLAVSLLSAQQRSASAQQRPAVDAYGDSLPTGAVLRLGTTRLQTRGGFAWAPDGQSLYTLKHGTVFVWDLNDGHCRETLAVPLIIDPFSSFVSHLALSRDGNRLVCTDMYGTIAVWDLEASKMISTPAEDMRNRRENVALAIHPRGKSFVTLRQNGELLFRDMATCEVKQKVKLPGEQWYEVSIAFSPDGQTLAVGCSRPSAAIHLIKDGNIETIKDAHEAWLYQIAFLPDGRLISSGTAGGKFAGQAPAKNQIHLWDVADRKPQLEWPMDGSLPVGCSVAFSSDGRTMASVHSDRIVIWDASNQTIVRTIEPLSIYNAMRAHVAIDPLDRYVAVADNNNYVRLWDLKTGQPRLSTDRHHQSSVLTVAWSPDGKTIATGDSHGELRFWNSADGKPVGQFGGSRWGAWSARFSPDGRRLSFCSDQLQKGEAASSGAVQWVEVATGKLSREHVVGGNARLATPSPDQSQIALAVEKNTGDPFAADKPMLVVLDAETGKEQLRAEIAGRPEAVHWSSDGRQLHCCDSTGLNAIEVATGKLISRFALPHEYPQRSEAFRRGGPTRAAFLERSPAVITCGAAEICGWSTLSGEKRWTMKTAAAFFRGLAISPDESIVAVIASDGDAKAKTLRLYDIATERELAHYDLGIENGDRLVFSPDGGSLLIGFYDGTALVFDVVAAIARAGF